jgi:two-component system sensor histidine kinase PrrB
VRVAVAAGLGAVVVAAVVAAVLVVLLSRREVATLDRRLDALSQVLVTRISAEPGTPRVADREARLLVRGLGGGLAVTVRDAAGERSAGAVADPAGLPATDGSVQAGGRDYRVRTAALPGGGTVTVGLPEAATSQAVARVRRDTVLVALAAALGAALLGWVLAGRALRPLRVLRERTAALPGRGGAAERGWLAAPPVGSSAESADLAEALGGLLDRVERARAEGESALASAQDFAVAANHELRTPLTTLRTDLDVLAAHPGLPPEQVGAVVAELQGTYQRIEGTLTALLQLAGGEPGGPAVRVDLADVVDQAVRAARRGVPGEVRLDADLPDAEVPVLGSEAGLRLAVDNLLANALRHAGASRVAVSVLSDPAAGWARVCVDDDGRGLPPEDRTRVFGRFVRGRTAGGQGSGLGLALVAQQAGLHGGRAELTDSPLGGLRAVLDVPLAPTG